MKNGKRKKKGGVLRSVSIVLLVVLLTAMAGTAVVRGVTSAWPWSKGVEWEKLKVWNKVEWPSSSSWWPFGKTTNQTDADADELPGGETPGEETPEVPSADPYAAFDVVVKTQLEFYDLLSSPTWFGAESVAFVGEFVFGVLNNRGVEVPYTVKVIQGFNNAKITVTNSVAMAKGGLWYSSIRAFPSMGIDGDPMDGYSITDLTVHCTGMQNMAAFVNCVNLINCTGIYVCAPAAPGMSDYVAGFYNCIKLTNCTGKAFGRGPVHAYGIGVCSQLVNCKGTGIVDLGTGSVTGYGFYSCKNATGCVAGDTPSLTALWGGTNVNCGI